jgi:hypothetical protein
VKNIDIRTDAQKSGVKLWQIADELGLSDCNFSRKLRKELPDSEKEKIRQIIVRLREVRR